MQKNNKTLVQELRHMADACCNNTQFTHEENLCGRAANYIQDLEIDIFYWKCACLGSLVALLWVVGSGQ